MATAVEMVIERPSTGYAQDSGPILVIPGTRGVAGVRKQAAKPRTGWSLRARILALIVVTAALLGINALLGGMPADAADLRGGAGEVIVVVQPGDTLWALAEEAAPDLDPRAAILQIRQANDLPDSSLMTGQRLIIPDFTALP